ncbi:helix-turn-helix transcriptional regulator [Streptomyces umbrinus]|uniref:helix-turn-helix transcriptional regulator n=1 Tax=Streptomyces umbrinus TaxID=67370 RepID=UPI00344279C4
METPPEQHGHLVGRADEIAALNRVLDAAFAGLPSIRLVEGPAGIGKTALVDHVLATRDACTVLRVSGVSWESDLDQGVVRQLLRIDDDTPQSVISAGQLLHRLWTGQQEHAPLVVVVDDAHLADVASLRAIRSAMRRMSEARVLVVLCARDGVAEVAEVPEASPAVQPDEERPLPMLGALEFLDDFRDDAIRPGPLDPEAVRTLAHDLCGLTLDLPGSRRLCRHTRGNPRYAGQLLRELPHETWTDWQPELPAPERYASAVRHRLTHCGATTRALLEACAVLGAGASLSLATALAEIDDPLPAVDEACTAGLVSATTTPGRMQLSFVHPLVRATVLTGIGMTRRAALHSRAAEITGDQGSRLAHRVAATTVADEALAQALDRYAADRARAGEWATVADTLVQASRLSPGHAERQDRLLRAVDAMIGAGDIPQATVFVGELESFPADTLREVVLGYLAIMRGRPAEAETFLTRAQEQCDPKRHQDLTARIYQRRVLHALGRWDADALVTWARRAVELDDPSDPSVVESEAVLGLGLAASGRHEEAVAAYETAAARLPGGAQPQRFHLGRGWVDLALDAPETARRRLEAAVPTGYRFGSTRISLWAQGWLARTQFVLGAWTEALETVQRAATRLGEVRIELVRPLVHWTAAQIHALRGDWDRADHHVQAGIAAPHRYEVMLIPSCLARAQVAEARGDYARALEALSPLVQLPSRRSVDEPGFWPWQDVYANALVMTGRLDDAEAFLAPQEELAARRDHRSTQARLGLARGRLTGARGDIDAAREQFERALGHLEHLPLLYDRARVNFAYGQTLRRAGKRREADTVLLNARDAYVSLGALTYVERCDRELQASGIHSTRLTPGRSTLTPQERAVARLVATGATNKQAALDLYISVKTVQYHLTHIYAKLGIRSRSELAACFKE